MIKIASIEIASCLASDTWVSKDAFRIIVEATCKAMRDRLRNPRKLSGADFHEHTLERARGCLNETLSVSFQNQFRQAIGLDREQFISDAAAALRYFETIDRLVKLGFIEFETANAELREQLQGVVQSGVEEQGAEPYRGRHVWEASFYPEALGLYSALFEEEPLATANRATGKSENPTNVFLSETVYAVRQSSALNQLEGAAATNGIELPDWELQGPDAMRNRIAKWKKFKTKTGTSPVPLYRENASFYLKHLYDPDDIITPEQDSCTLGD